MISKVLIANRGEIAIRAIRAARNLGILSVAVYSKTDAASLHVSLADEAICIGEAAAKDSYLNVPAVLSAAHVTGCDAVYPGYGFLAENADFVKACRDEELIFIGPSPETMELMGSKSRARSTMEDSNVPVVPGSSVVESYKEALDYVRESGFPVMIKASAGGGGKGMRASFSEEEFRKDFPMAKNEAAKAFGDDSMYIEKLILGPKHIEIQVLADKYGHVVVFDERECSMQRNHQKMVEESPAPVITETIRREMKAATVRVAKASDYTGAGTVEFILDPEMNFYFMEMNTRIQVEHPVTELISGVDLVEWQFRIASGEPLDFTTEDIPRLGHAFECRINAEDPENGFRPGPGRINALHLPGGNGVRVETALYPGYSIPPDYDSLVAKIIVLGRDRQDALNRMYTALDETVISGVSTNLNFQAELIRTDVFRSGDVDTTFVAEYIRGKKHN